MYYLIGYGYNNQYKVLVEAVGANDAVWKLDAAHIGAFYRANILNKFSCLSAFRNVAKVDNSTRYWRKCIGNKGYTILPRYVY